MKSCQLSSWSRRYLLLHTQIPITVCTKDHQWMLYLTSSTQPSHYTFLTSFLILFSRLFPGHLYVFFSFQVYRLKFYIHFICACVIYVPPIFFSLILGLLTKITYIIDVRWPLLNRKLLSQLESLVPLVPARWLAPCLVFGLSRVKISA